MSPDDLRRLIPTHNTLRTPTLVSSMADGWAPRCGDSPVKLVVFEGVEGVFVHDGHHRVIKAILRGESIPDQDVLVDRTTVEGYLSVNPGVWYTPFDPRTQCRRPDFKIFKDEARQVPVEEVEAWIRARGHLYIEPRLIKSMEELARV